MKNISVIIPAYKPDEKLLNTLKEVIEIGFEDIIVVDDGGGSDYEAIFSQVEKLPECVLLRHEVNKGKGAALKTAMKFFVENRKGYKGVVTADADGQHLAKDILTVAEEMAGTEKIVLGCRDFSLEHVPARSRFGNRTTSAVMRLFFGMKLSDTQTGLRGFPAKYINELLTVDGNRYEYETHMLFHMSRKRIPFSEVKIETVYIDENQTSHFRVIHDSIRIYSLIIKYLLSSVAASAVDSLSFLIFQFMPFLEIIPIPLTFTASFLARAISSLVNFVINAKVVFGDNVSKRTFIRYYLLVIIQICVSAATVFVIEKVLGINSEILLTVIKVIVDTILFFISFRIQHKWVFNKIEK